MCPNHPLPLDLSRLHGNNPDDFDDNPVVFDDLEEIDADDLVEIDVDEIYDYLVDRLHNSDNNLEIEIVLNLINDLYSPEDLIARNFAFPIGHHHFGEVIDLDLEALGIVAQNNENQIRMESDDDDQRDVDDDVIFDGEVININDGDSESRV